MRTLAIDIETYSSTDLAKSGVYAYAAAADFKILLFAYGFDDDTIEVIDLACGERLPAQILEALEDDSIVKTAFNANFERTCLCKYLKKQLSPKGWRCTAVQAAELGLPLKLEGAAAALNIHEEKMKEGKELIRYFSVPCRPSEANRGRTRNLPCDAPEKWDLFKKYCKRDVEVERAIRNKLERYAVSDEEQKLWMLDQNINDRGILVDGELVHNAVKCDEEYKQRMLEEAKAITGLENPNSVPRLKEWLMENGVEIPDLSKKSVAKAAEKAEGKVERLLKLRPLISKTSTKKYGAIIRALCPDSRVRGLFQFYGANRTGRWAGRLIQVHNLPQNKISDIATARELVQRGEFDSLEMLFESLPEVLSELIRTAFIPAAGNRFIIADYNAIEARIIAYLADERWKLDVFKGHGKIYEASASKMFKVPIEEITKTSTLRKKGKVAELALGYQGGVNALKAMGAADMGLKEEELPEIVRAWRNANANIVRYWYDIENAAKRAVKNKVFTSVGKVKFHVENGILFITLPSGRSLSYIRPKIETDARFNRECLTYEGMDQTSKTWMRQNTYGGKLVENIVQATARDCLGEAMLRVEEAGYKIVMHVHDEIIIEAPQGFGSVEEVCGILGKPVSWAPRLPLRAEGFESEFYKKD